MLDQGLAAAVHAAICEDFPPTDSRHNGKHHGKDYVEALRAARMLIIRLWAEAKSVDQLRCDTCDGVLKTTDAALGITRLPVCATMSNMDRTVVDATPAPRLEMSRLRMCVVR